MKFTPAVKSAAYLKLAVTGPSGTPRPPAALLTFDDAAALLGVSADQIRALAHLGTLKLVDLGYRTKRVTRASVNRLVARWEGAKT
jgi:excisionase family DNA binding protein